jgi:hypothetical protein
MPLPVNLKVVILVSKFSSIPHRHIFPRLSIGIKLAQKKVAKFQLKPQHIYLQEGFQNQKCINQNNYIHRQAKKY